MIKISEIKKILVNYNWKTRYNNLKKKYDEQNEIIKSLEEQIKNSNNLKLLNQKDALLRRYQLMIQNLRNDYKELCEKVSKWKEAE